MKLAIFISILIFLGTNPMALLRRIGGNLECGKE
jgi:hypothetical protein